MTVKEQLNTQDHDVNVLRYNDAPDSHLFRRTEDDEKISTSVDDREFLEIMDQSMIKDPNGNWSAPLPFRSPKIKLPNNRQQAFKRAMNLHHSLQRDPEKKKHLVTFMGKILDSKSAEVAPIGTNSECWYLPLFGVYNRKKPGEIRGVFDSSAVCQGTSLNKALLSGPNITNNLLGILLRFRMDKCAISADIERMFYSFYVNEDHRDYLRFFWYKDNDPSSDLIEYRMCVHVFGNTPSPAVATYMYGLRKTVEHSDHDVKNYVTRNFYVDDGLMSVPTSDEAIHDI